MKTKKTSIAKLSITLASLLTMFLVASSNVYAQPGNWFGGGGGGTDTDITISKDDLNLPGAKDNIESGDVTAVLNIVYIIAGITAVVVIIIGGIRYVTSDGDSSGISAAKNTVMYAVVGLIVVLAAAAITNFVLQNVAK